MEVRDLGSIGMAQPRYVRRTKIVRISTPKFDFPGEGLKCRITDSW